MLTVSAHSMSANTSTLSPIGKRPNLYPHYGRAVYISVIAMSNTFTFYLHNWFCVLNTIHFPRVSSVLSNLHQHYRAIICPDGCRFISLFNIHKYYNHPFLLNITTFYHMLESFVLHILLKFRLQGALPVCDDCKGYVPW